MAQQDELDRKFLDAAYEEAQQGLREGGIPIGSVLVRNGENREGGELTAGDWKNKGLHARMSLGGTELLCADVPPDRFQPIRSAYLSLTLDSDQETERVFGLLSEGGQIFMQMQETFFASRFAMLRDRFGTSWMLLHKKPL